MGCASALLIGLVVLSGAAPAAPQPPGAAGIQGEEGPAAPVSSPEAGEGKVEEGAPPAGPPATPAAPAEGEAREGKEPEAGEAPAGPFYESVVQVTASKVETSPVDAPAAVTVVDSRVIETSPTLNLGDLLRTVPGMNVTQTSARDYNLITRMPTGVMSTYQLALIDGRPIYQDFFGFVTWDLASIQFDEIRQIEVVRGPASAVWGANAMSGVVNIITKSPREMLGTTVTAGGGAMDREAGEQDEGTGWIRYVDAAHAWAPDDRWSFKVTGGVYAQDPFLRPAGTIDNAYHTPYPDFANEGTTQPKLDFRADLDFPDGERKLVMAGGYAGTSGMFHTGVGPFRLDDDTWEGYLRTEFSQGGLQARFFVNSLDGSAPGLMSYGLDGKPIEFLFETQTYDGEVRDVRELGRRNRLSYGGNVRRSEFDLSVAPLGSSRDEGGVYLQDEVSLGDHFRWLVGARADFFDVLDGPVFSPRTTFLIKPTEKQAFRVSFNRAFHAPSLLNNYLDMSILNQIDLGLIDPALAGMTYTFPIHAIGNLDLDETSLDAWEIGFTGQLAPRVRLDFAAYRNEVEDDIFFTQSGSWTSANPPPGWPLPPEVLDLLIAASAFGPGKGLPSEFTYVNLARATYRGIELGVEVVVGRSFLAFANAAWQDEPVPDGYDLSELNLPPTLVFNAGINGSWGRHFADLSLSYSDKAYWQDVLDARYAGWSDSYALLNAGFGVRFGRDRRSTLALKVTNLLDQEVQQHIFGDIIGRQAVVELKMGF